MSYIIFEYNIMFVILRHGQSVWNKENKFTGLIDVELSEQGKLEAFNAGKILRNYKFDAIFSSQLMRTIQTAEIIQNNQSNKIEIQKFSVFQERDYGDLTGKNKTELKNEYGEQQVKIWRRSYLQGPPGGESLQDVSNRVGPSYDDYILPLLKEGKNVLLVAHGNSLRALFV